MRFAFFEFFVGSADNQPPSDGVSVIEHLSQEIGTYEHAAVFRNGQRLIADSHSSRAFHDKIKFLSLGMFMERVCAFRRQPPKSRAQNLASRSLQKIRVRNFHHVRRSPLKLLIL